MVKKGMLWFLTCLSAVSYGQSNSYRDLGIIKASATIAPSTMLNRNDANIYLHGFLEYFPESKFSLRGETYFFIDGQNKSGNTSFVRQAMRTHFGVFLHGGKRNLSPYLGLQPGVVLLRPTDSYGDQLRVSPSFALHVGANYFIWKYFHFFGDLGYLNSSYRGLATGTTRTDELVFSAGLGFQLPTKTPNH
jgi:hypothetical protein